LPSPTLLALLLRGAAEDTGTGAARFVVSSTGDVTDLSTGGREAEEAEETGKTVEAIHVTAETAGHDVDAILNYLRSPEATGTLTGTPPPEAELAAPTVDTGFSFEAAAVAVSMTVTSAYLAVKELFGGE
jgi:hypothetical protein